MALTGCEDVVDLDPVDARPVIEPEVRPRSISGGTLAVTAEGIAVAADPDRDRVHVVDLWARRVLHSVVLEPGDEPGRVAEGTDQLVHVVLRGYGGIATIDAVDGVVVARHRVCADPRGLAFDPASLELHVACAGGRLVHLDEKTGAVISREQLEPDLRDVLLIDGRVHVSRFRNASIVGPVTGDMRAPDLGGFQPGVAWRTFMSGSGEPMMLHQLASREPVPIETRREDLESDSLPYGGGGGHCEPGLVTAALTRFTADGGVLTTPLPRSRLVVDAAASPDGGIIALAMPGVPEGQPSAAVMETEGHGCVLHEIPSPEEQVTAVAFTEGGALVMQSREPARLLIQSNPLGSGAFGEELFAIDLPGGARYDTGHEIFHRSTESGLSCASCHPEGTDDGHVWLFETLGKRRTQSLDVGLADSAPFHWDGDMDDMGVLVEEVLAHRMGGMRQSPARSDSFMRWMFAQRRPAAGPGRDDPTLVAEGEALFVSLDCVRCHTGVELGGSLTTPVRGHALQVPSLHRVSLRPPFMHDGRSATLDDAVRDMIESTTSVSAAPDEVVALSAYMRTL